MYSRSGFRKSLVAAAKATLLVALAMSGWWLGDRASAQDMFGPGYDLIRDEGTDENRRGTINFIGDAVSVADDSSNGETEVTISSTSGAFDPWTGDNSETMDNANDDFIEWQGVGGADDTDLRIDLDGTHPILNSPTDSRIDLNEGTIGITQLMNFQGSLEGSGVWEVPHSGAGSGTDSSITIQGAGGGSQDVNVTITGNLSLSRNTGGSSFSIFDDIPVFNLVPDDGSAFEFNAFGSTLYIADNTNKKQLMHFHSTSSQTQYALPQMGVGFIRSGIDGILTPRDDVCLEDGTNCPAAGAGTMTTVKIGGTQLGGADIVTIDFDATDFSGTESPDKEVNITIDDDGHAHTSTSVTQFLRDFESDTMAGTLTADGLTLGANENITLGSQTLDHNGTDFTFDDDVKISAVGPDFCLEDNSQSACLHFEDTAGGGTVWLSNGSLIILQVDEDGVLSFNQLSDGALGVDGTGRVSTDLPNDSIKIQALDAIDEPADEEHYAFDSATGRGEWVVAGAGSDTNSPKLYYWPASATLPLQPVADLDTGAEDGVAPISKDSDTNLEILTIAFDDTADEFRAITFKVPSDVVVGSNVTITFHGYAATAAAEDVAIIFAHYAVADTENWDGNVTEEALTTTLTNTQDAKDIVQHTETSTSLGWAADDTIFAYIGRDGDHATDDGLTGDFNLTELSIEIPRS